MREWIATDLDSTLFHRSWIGEDAVAATWQPTADELGRMPSSWMRSGTYRLLEALSQSFSLVPVTARDMNSFARVNVEGLILGGPAVIANGAVILGIDGKPDAQWERKMIDLLAPWKMKLNELCEWLTRESIGNTRPRLVAGPDGLPAYLVAKAKDGWWQSPKGKVLLTGRDWAGCRVEVLSSELQVLPPGIGKRWAVEHVRDYIFDGRQPVMCMGDMPLDLEFMRLGGLITMPVGSVLERSWK